MGEGGGMLGDGENYVQLINFVTFNVFFIGNRVGNELVI